MTQPNNPWIYLSQPNSQANLRLFCFPYAGGGTRIFRHWPNHLSNIVEVCAIRLPGRESRIKETPLTKLSNLVEVMTPNLLPYLDKPFAFFGHSMGALLSFEVAHQLRQNYGLSPAHLLVSGHRAPHIPDSEPPIHDLPEPEFLQEISRLNGTPDAVLKDRELMQLLVPVLRADFSILETYIYQPKKPLNCPITVFGGLTDPETNEIELEAWCQHTTHSFSRKMFPGDHFFIHSAESDIFPIIQRSLDYLLEYQT